MILFLLIFKYQANILKNKGLHWVKHDMSVQVNKGLTSEYCDQNHCVTILKHLVKGN